MKTKLHPCWITVVEGLEGRTLLSQILPSAYGAIPDDGKDDRGAFQAALNAAHSGDTVAFANGTFNIAGEITLKSGVNITSLNSLGATLNFAVSSSGYAIRGSGVRDISFTNLNVRSNNGIFHIDNTTNLQFTNNDFVWGYAGSYYNRLAFFGGGYHERLRIERNLFHDSPTSDRNIELSGMSNSSYSYNRFYNVNDGGHIMNPGDNVSYSFNVGRLIHRMGIEIQQTDYPPKHWPVNFVVEGNVFYDWNKPYWDSMCLSVPVAGINVTIKNNYLRQNAWQGQWGQSDSSGSVRGSYGIEGPQGPVGQNGGTIESNVIVSERAVMAISAPGKNTIARNNQIYGFYSWSDIGGEPGAIGYGNVIESNNPRERDASKAPAPPEVIPGNVSLPTSPAGNPWQYPAPSPAPPLSTQPAYTPVLDETWYVDVTDYGWSSTASDSGPVEVNTSSDGAPILLNGKIYNKGLGVAGESTVVYKLYAQFAKFNCDVGVDDESASGSTLRFQVWGDGKLLFDSNTLSGKDGAKVIGVNVKGMQELKLITLSSGGAGSDAHGDWAGARLVYDPYAPPILDEPTW